MSARPVHAILLAGLGAIGACDMLLVDPAPLPQVEARFTLAPAPAAPEFGDFSEILAQVRKVSLTFAHGDQEHDTTVAGQVEGDELRVVVRLRPEEIGDWVEVRAELYTTLPLPVFSGTGQIRVYRFVADARLDLQPVPAAIEITPSSHSFRAIGDTLVLAAAARFATGDTIHGAVFDWSSSDPTVIEIVPYGRAISRGNGNATLSVSTLGFGHGTTVQVRQLVAQLTGVAPADTTIAPSTSYQLRPLGVDPRGSPLLPGAAVLWTAGPGVTVSTLGIVVSPSSGSSYVDGAAAGSSFRASLSVAP